MFEKEYQHIQEFVDKLKSTNSTNEKIEILKEYKDDDDICNLLEYVYSPFKQYYITSTQLKKLKHLCTDTYFGSLFCMLDNFTNRVWTGHQAITYANGLVKIFPEYKELIHSIIDKNLKT